MKLIGLLPVRNEDWVLGVSARAALQWCDELVILLHACTDDSTAIAFDLRGEFPGRVNVMACQESKWDEMSHRQHMLEAARNRGASHIAIIDADEVLTGNLLGRIRADIEKLPRGWLVELPGYNLRGSVTRYHKNGIWGDRHFATAFTDDARLEWKGDRFHHREPMGLDLSRMRLIPQHHGGVMHLWGASERRLIAKHRLYKITERLRWPEKPVSQIDQMYSLAFDPGADKRYEQRWTYMETPAEWWEPYADLMQYLNVDAEPWQEQECERLIAEHGARRFAGLQLFGIDAAADRKIATI